MGYNFQILAETKFSKNKFNICFTNITSAAALLYDRGTIGVSLVIYTTYYYQAN